MVTEHRGLEHYRDKRQPGQTPEPFGSERAPVLSGPLRFVVQKHAASRTHYDFRIELGGVLRSWAVPKGPPLDPSSKRLAIRVEDHPLDYLDFEGVIPAPGYGAGAVVVWDQGIWCPAEDPAKALAEGKLAFDLRGYKLHGRYALVRTEKAKGAKESWLLLKKADANANSERELSEASIYSGLLVEERAELDTRVRELDEELAALSLPKRELDARQLRPTLCTAMKEPFSDPDWLFELKYDGYRSIAESRAGQPFLRYREGANVTALFPEVRRSLELLPCTSCVLDGEIVVFDSRGHPDFGLLQARGALSRAWDIEMARRRTPATYVAFDLLELDGRDLRGLPLIERKALLARTVPQLGPIKYCDHVEGSGEALYARIEELELEGMVAKRKDSTYSSRRDSAWRKIHRPVSGDFVIIGYTLSQTRPGSLAALHLAAYEGETLRYAGKVGSGLSQRERRNLQARLDALPGDEHPVFRGKSTAADVWVTPTLVARVRYREWEAGKRLRQPVYLELRSDLSPHECKVPAHLVSPAPAVLQSSDSPSEPGIASADASLATTAPTLATSNLGKVFWPADGFTKGDLLDYYQAIAPWLLPYLRDRPLVITRYPDGIEGKSFFQRDAPTWIPSWFQTQSVWSKESGREVRCFVCNDLESLLYLINLGTIPLHLWSSRITDLDRPDWCILDLDPKGAPWQQVQACASAIHKLCSEIGLPCYLKTSGSSGLHVLLPLGAQCTHAESRDLANILARVIESRLGDIATTERNIARRGGKVYLDWLQNRHGQLLCAPLSARALPGAPVSMPMRWRELQKCRGSRQYTIASAPKRMRRLREDPFRGVLTDAPNLLSALAKLKEQLA